MNGSCSDSTGSCGALGKSCCGAGGDASGTFCSAPNTYCSLNTFTAGQTTETICLACGGAYEPCCVGRPADYVCDYGLDCPNDFGPNHVCIPCGGEGQPCCLHLHQPCDAGLGCSGYTGSNEGTCVSACGHQGQPCCWSGDPAGTPGNPTGVTNTQVCSSGLTCDAAAVLTATCVAGTSN
jgi:hypothetical protein